jgi:hypothetical protein
MITAELSSRRSWKARLSTAAVAGGVAWAAWRARATVPGGHQRWRRTNHRGEQLTLLEGPAWAAGALTGLALATGLSGRQRAAVMLATGGSAVFGAVDDLTESGSSKGLRGHLGALAHGQVTTGALKIVGIGAGGLVAAALLVPQSRLPVRLADVAVSGGLIAGAANLANLLDLRPGRLLKPPRRWPCRGPPATARRRAPAPHWPCCLWIWPNRECWVTAAPTPSVPSWVAPWFSPPSPVRPGWLGVAVFSQPSWG